MRVCMHTYVYIHEFMHAYEYEMMSNRVRYLLRAGSCTKRQIHECMFTYAYMRTCYLLRAGSCTKRPIHECMFTYAYMRACIANNVCMYVHDMGTYIHMYNKSLCDTHELLSVISDTRYSRIRVVFVLRYSRIRSSVCFAILPDSE